MADPMINDYPSNDEHMKSMAQVLGEVIFDMSFAMGLRWNSVPRVVLETMMDRLNGSRGLYDWITDEAIAFEKMWNGLDEEDPRTDDYYIVVDAWFDAAFNKLVLDKGYNSVKCR